MLCGSRELQLANSRQIKTIFFILYLMVDRVGFEPTWTEIKSLPLKPTQLTVHNWYPRLDLNQRPTPYESVATTSVLLGYNLVGKGGIEPPLFPLSGECFTIKLLANITIHLYHEPMVGSTIRKFYYTYNHHFLNLRHLVVCEKYRYQYLLKNLL